MGPVVPGATFTGGARVPGTSYELDPIQAAFNIGAMIRWLDFNDTWLAAEWGHPSDNLGAILAVADYLSRGGKRAHGPRRAHGDDQGARDTRRPCSGEQLQPRGPRSRAVGARGLDGRGHRDARRHPRADRQCRIECLDRRRSAAHLSACAEHRLAQELGGRGCHQPGGASCLVRAQGRDGVPLGVIRQDLGIPGCAVQGQAAWPRRSRSAATSWKTCCSRFPSPRSSMRRRPSKRP